MKVINLYTMVNENIHFLSLALSLVQAAKPKTAQSNEMNEILKNENISAIFVMSFPLSDDEPYRQAYNLILL